MWPISDPRIAERDFRRLLIRVPNWLGDQILCTPALSAVRERYPKAEIVGHGGKGAFLLYRGGPWFDDFVVHGKEVSMLRQARELRPRGFDACLLLTGSFRTAAVAFLARIPHRIGYRWSGRTPLLTAHWHRPRPGGKKAPYPTKLYFLDLVARLGAKGGGRVTIPLTEGDRKSADDWFRSQGIGPEEKVLCMCVGAAFGPSKLWPAHYFAAAADHMQEKHGARVVVLCAPGEEAIGAAVRSFARRPLVDTGLAPLSIDVLKAVIARSRALLTNDTGPRHIAASFRIPIVCVMGSTDPIYTDTDLEQTTVLREGVDCSPCHLKICPIDHRCMVRLTPEKAIPPLEAAWARGPG
jgi:heptosyltransferase-2